MNFGDYSDGFSPANQSGAAGTSVPGCSVADDFTHELGDAAEGRIAAALAFRASNNQSCPAPSGFSEPRVAKAILRPGEVGRPGRVETCRHVEPHPSALQPPVTRRRAQGSRKKALAGLFLFSVN